jgi:hypothetical protein
VQDGRSAFRVDLWKEARHAGPGAASEKGERSRGRRRASEPRIAPAQLQQCCAAAVTPCCVAVALHARSCQAGRTLSDGAGQPSRIGATLPRRLRIQPEQSRGPSPCECCPRCTGPPHAGLDRPRNWPWPTRKRPVLNHVLGIRHLDSTGACTLFLLLRRLSAEETMSTRHTHN